jgi:hypothetical protein
VNLRNKIGAATMDRAVLPSIRMTDWAEFTDYAQRNRDQHFNCRSAGNAG